MATKKKIHPTKKKNVKKISVTKKKMPKKVNKIKRPTVKRTKEASKAKQIEENVSDSDNGEDMLNMVEEDDLTFLKNAVSNRSYNLFNKIKYSRTPSTNSKKQNLDEDDQLENNYEEHMEVEETEVRNLLPIKTQNKIIPQTMIKEKVEDYSAECENNNGDQDSDIEEEFSLVNENEFDSSKEMTTAELLSRRSKMLQEKKVHIGTLSAGLLENPEEKIVNFKSLLELLDNNVPEIYMSLKKIVIISLLEVFKDLLPTYEIKMQDNTGVKLKKDTLKISKYEEALLQYYKKYLQKLEKFIAILFKKQGDKRERTEAKLKLGQLSLQAICDLLVTHPYFNYSENIVQVVVPFLNNKNRNVREIVAGCCKTVFKEDKKEKISLKILQVLNQHLKKHAHNVHQEMLEILLCLRIQDVNLDQKKEHDIKEKKLKSHQQNVLQLSKKERKRKKRLIQLEKELLETKAEENKQLKMKNLTEITKIVFGIYFRVLKSSTNPKILSVCLEGLAKFSHSINVEYFVDLINVLNNLLNEDWLGYKEKLNCIRTVFVILSGVGEALNIDPTRFYVTLYKDLLTIHASKTHNNFDILLKTLHDALIKRRKKITNKRIIGFTKRLATLSLQLIHNSSLSCLGIIKIMLQLNKAVDVLLDLDTSVGDGQYMAELEDPEYCNASSTSLFEMVPLVKHYHPVVAKYAKHIVNGVPSTGNGSLAPEYSKLPIEELFQMHDMTQMAFNPAVPIPDKKSIRANVKKPVGFADDDFKLKCYKVLQEPMAGSCYIEL